MTILLSRASNELLADLLSTPFRHLPSQSLARQWRRVPHPSRAPDGMCFSCFLRARPRPLQLNAKGPRTASLPLKRAIASSQNSRSTAEDASSAKRNTTSSELQDPSLPSYSEQRRTLLSKRFSHVMDHLQTNIFTASQRLNDLTGYSGIEALKKAITAQEQLVAITRQDVQAAKAEYTAAISSRSASQREVNDLLQRRATWSPAELERFTELYRSDHANEVAEQQAQQKLAEAERRAEEATSQLSNTILARYHEEQIWSDKIRRMSTWGTWGLMGVNVLLFLIFQVLVEPWRRARLVKGFDEKVKEAIASNAANAENLNNAQVMLDLDTSEAKTADASSTALASTTTEHVGDSIMEADSVNILDKAFHLRWLEVIRDLFSDRVVSMRKLDHSIVVIESMVVGAAFASAVLTLLRRN